MLLSEVWPDDNLDLTEDGIKSQLGKYAMAGALGAGLLGAGLGASKFFTNNTQQSATSDASATTDPDRPDSSTSPAIPAPNGARQVRNGAEPHGGFPSGLHQQSSVTPAERVNNFVQSISPMITQVNSAILADRNKIISIRNNRTISNENKEWLCSLADRYNVTRTAANGAERPINDIITDLLTRVDAIPANLAMGQAALESGWGSSDLTRQSNNLFGQRATRRHDDAQKIRNTDNIDYRSYDTLEHSIRSYMHNLNTHPSYSDFRQARSQLRRQPRMNSATMARELTNHLQAYSTNQRYFADLNRVMRMFPNR